MFKRLIAVALCLCFCLIWSTSVYATEDPAAQDISGTLAFIGDGYRDFSFLVDKNTETYVDSDGRCTFSLMHEAGIASLYLMFDLEYGSYSVENATTGEIYTAGTQGFLHEYLNLLEIFGTAPTSVTLHFDTGVVRLSEIYAFTAGQVPDFVQKWGAPLENQTDILLLSAHGDDDQLFYAGLLPLYAAEKKANVQVAYLTNHRNTTYVRTHEILNGLWAVGCTAYPVMPDFPDFRIDNLNDTYAEFDARGVTEERLLGYVVELLRRFKPKVVVGHDIEGEYGHGMHMVFTDCLRKAVDVSNDQTFIPESAQKYGVWDVPKTYLHLYPQKLIEINYDKPLAAFGGLTAFEATQKYGYPCHKSQQDSWFTDWLYGENNEITKASQITRYNPSRFGLYRTTVGEDVKKNDFLENVTTYAEDARLEQEAQQKAEQEKAEQEAARLEQERQELQQQEEANAEAQRLEKERLEKEQLEQERQEQERQQKQQRTLTIWAIVIITVLVIALVAVLFFLWRNTMPSRIDY